MSGTISAISSVGGCLFGFPKWKLTCVDATTGEAAWSESFDGQALAVGEHLVALDQKSGLLKLARASVEGFSLIGETRVMEGDRVETPLGYADGHVFVRHASGLVAVRLVPADSAE